MERVVFDIESLPNYFCIVFSPLESDEVVCFEINDKINQRDEIMATCKAYELIAYNNHSYDDILLNFIAANKEVSAGEINRISQAIISYGKTRDKKTQAIFKNYKHSMHFKTIDVLTLLASSKLRVSLKHLQVMIKWHNVQEFECDWEVALPQERWDDCLEYCVNDVLSLKAVCIKLKRDFELRDYVHETTGLDVHSKDPVKIAELAMCTAIAKGLNVPVKTFMWNTVQENKPVDEIVVKDLILDIIEFTTPLFQGVLDMYKSLSFSPAKEQAKPIDQRFGYPVVFNGMWLVFGLGGLHMNYGLKSGKKKFKPKGMVHKPKIDEKLIQADVSSYYPSIRIEYLAHRFDPFFLTEYSKAYQEKKDGKLSRDSLLEGYAKLKLNSTFGLTNSQYSALYAPADLAYATTINGQLMIAMFIERLHIAGFNVIGTNTDSVNLYVPDNRWDEYMEICTQWESDTKMKLDHDEFTVIYEQSCNNYIAITPKGEAKTKGSFVPELNLLKGYQYPVVKLALLAYFKDKIPVEKFIKGHNDIYDYCMSNKMGKSKKTGNKFKAIHNKKVLQSTNRYYAAVGPEAGYMYKNAGLGDAHVCKDSGVMIFNVFVEKEMKDYNINYLFYIRIAKKIIHEIEGEQLNLF